MRDKERGKCKSTKKRQIESSVLEHWCKDCNYWPFHNSKGAACDSQQCSTSGDQLCEQEIGVRSTCDQLRQTVRAGRTGRWEARHAFSSTSSQTIRCQGFFKYLFNKQPDNQMSSIFRIVSSISSTKQTIRCQVLAAGGNNVTLIWFVTSQEIHFTVS